ncbi:MAG: CDP-alcohol phosphatidyltransferase family protein [Planctomycetota bacterium]|nr:CDP-alcohol phosphatidyltransferase family protein [Planctomycetota bacterium]
MSTAAARTGSATGGPRVRPMLAALPNALTVSRLVLAALFFLSLELARRPIHDEAWLLSAAGLFVLGAVTDALDGYLARRWNVITVFGRVMDPVADKVLVIGAFIYLAGPAFLTTVEARSGQVRPVQATAVDAWMVVVILARELIVTSLRSVLESRGIDFSASWTGKAKMIAQAVAVPTVLCLVALGSNLTGASPYDLPRPPMPEWINGMLRAVVWTTVGVTAVSVVPYLTRGSRLLRAG